MGEFVDEGSDKIAVRTSWPMSQSRANKGATKRPQLHVRWMRALKGRVTLRHRWCVITVDGAPRGRQPGPGPISATGAPAFAKSTTRPSTPNAWRYSRIASAMACIVAASFPASNSVMTLTRRCLLFALPPIFRKLLRSSLLGHLHSNPSIPVTRLCNVRPVTNFSHAPRLHRTLPPIPEPTDLRPALAGFTKSSMTATASGRCRDPIGIRLLTRNGHDWAPRYPLIVEAVDRLKMRSC